MSLRARVRLSPDDLAWLLSIAAVVALAWLAPALARLIPLSLDP